MAWENGLEQQYVIKNNKKMAFGYTTGSCAAAAAKAACIMICSGEACESVELMTPKGILLSLLVEDSKREGNKVSCAIRKDGGDDPDVTTGLLIYASVEIKRVHSERITVRIDGGKGVGRVTKPGLEQPIGTAAINRIPREMIATAVKEVCKEYGVTGQAEVIISVPKGEETAQKTFNPRLGILGGISILGTSGIVEPMSEKALIDTIAVELKVKRRTGEKQLLLVPGNYGIRYLQEELGIDLEQAVKCSNYVGETIDMALNLGFENVLLVSHIGKLIKVAGGIMNTHSRSADARMELLASAAILEGADAALARQILESVTTEEGIRLVREAGLLEKVMMRLMERIQYYLNHRAYDRMNIGAITFAGDYKELGRTENATEILNKFRQEKE